MVSARFCIGLICLAALPAVAPAAPQRVASGEEIIVRAPIARVEIERILGADNLDTVRDNPTSVAAIMSRIPRGRAPDDFWQAYERHVRAWERYGNSVNDHADQTERMLAEHSINLTFDAVERIARRYGARMPEPKVN